MSLSQDYKDFSQHRPWMARALLLLVVVIVSGALLRGLLPVAIKFGTEYWMQTQGVEAHVQDMDISLLAGRFVLKGVSAKNAEGKGFSLQRLQLAWQWRPLFDQKIVVDDIQIHGLKLDIVLFDNAAMNVAGLNISPASGEETKQGVESSASQPWDAILNHLQLADIELCIQKLSSDEKVTLDYCFKLQQLSWQGELAFKPSTQTSADDVPLYVQGGLNIQQLLLHNNLLQLNLFSIASIDLTSVQVDTLKNVNIHRIELIQFSSLQRANKTGDDDAQLFAFDRLNIKSLKLIQFNELDIGVIELNGSQAYLYINKQGEMDFKKWLPEKSTDMTSNKNVESQSSSKPFSYIVDKFILTSDQHLKFVDDSLKEPFSADIHHLNLTYKQLNSRVPEKFGHLSLELYIDKHGRLKLDADLNPLADRPSIKGTGKVAGFDLRMFSPLTTQHIGHDIKSGQLDIDLTLNVDKGVIDSNMALALHHFMLQTLSKQKAETLNSEFGFPLNTSLSLLRDKDNTIRLDIPVTGDIESPEFDPKDAILKASSKAITAAVLHYYTPFGLVFAAESVFDLATALNFKPVLFPAGSSELTGLHKEELDKLAALMTDRPGIHLTLCGFSNIEDNKILFPITEKNNTSDEARNSVSEALTVEQLAALKMLADQRSSSVKNYLVKIKNIDASRLIECSAEYQQDEIAGVNISI